MLVNNSGILILLLPPIWLLTMVSYTPNLFALAQVLLKLGMELCCPLRILVKVISLLLLSHCVLITSFMSLNYVITFYPLGSFVMTTTAVWSLILISFILRTTPRVRSFCRPPALAMSIQSVFLLKAPWFLPTLHSARRENIDITAWGIMEPTLLLF